MGARKDCVHTPPRPQRPRPSLALPPPRLIAFLAFACVGLSLTGCPPPPRYRVFVLEPVRYLTAAPFTGPQYVLAGRSDERTLHRVPQPDTVWTELSVPDADTLYDADLSPILSETLVAVGELRSTGADVVAISSDDGQTWVSRSNAPGLPSAVAPDAAPILARFDPSASQRIWAGYSFNGTAAAGPVLYRSDDLGASWAAVTSGVTGRFVRQLAFDADPQVRYLHTDQVLRSVDGGANWSAFTTGLGSFPEDLVPDPGTPRRVYARGRQRVYRSDGGGAWSEIAGITSLVQTSAFSLPIRAFAVDPTDPNRLYLSLEAIALYTSADGGSSWTELSGSPSASVYIYGFTFDQILIDPTQPTRLVVAGPSGIYQSDDRGLSWRFLETVGLRFTRY